MFKNLNMEFTDLTFKDNLLALLNIKNLVIIFDHKRLIFGKFFHDIFRFGAHLSNKRRAFHGILDLDIVRK